MTAIEWLVKEIPSIDWENSYWKNILEQAKELEKQQIIDSCKDFDGTYFLCEYESYEQYYNEKFKNK